MNLQRNLNYTINLDFDLADELSEIEEIDLHTTSYRESSLNIPSVTCRRRKSTYCIVVHRLPLLLDQKARSSLLTLCSANVGYTGLCAFHGCRSICNHRDMAARQG